MRNRLIVYIFIFNFPIFFFLSSCKKFVSVPTPVNEIVTQNVFTNDASAVAAQTAIYTQMQNNWEGVYAALDYGLVSDELTNYYSDPVENEYYTNSLQSKDILEPWVDAYVYIYDANAVIGGLQEYSGVTSVSKQQLTGEAEFVRSFWNFILVNTYGSIPLVTTTDYATNAVAGRASIDQVYAQMVSDLSDAANKLNTNYVDATDSVVTTERVRPTKGAAEALLARVYLYKGAFDSSEQQSTLVINSPLYKLCASLDSVFLKNNTEGIWQLPPVQPSSNLATPEGQQFILTDVPSNVYEGAALSSQLLNSFEPGDLRRTHWVNAYTADNVSYYYYPYKYKLWETSSAVEYSIIFRLAEQYLIRAEARAQQNNLGGAAADLNIIRTRAGLANIPDSIASSQPALLGAILHERQVELFTEWGHRWFDLIRSKTVNAVMSVVTPAKGGSWSPDWALFPIPFSDLTKDANLTQNAGY
jgi:starch-binding outer membrane protein, SusD/RagB family